MNQISGTYLFLLGLLGLLMTSCGASKNTGDMEKLPKAKDTELLMALDSISGQTFDSFYSKVSTKYTDSSQNVSFKTSLRMVNDSAFNALITFARIPIFNALITPDSVRISNKREKCYIAQSVGYFKENFGVDFSHKNMEELMLGLPVDYNEELKYYRVKNPYAYIMSSHRKRNANRIERDLDKEVIIYYELSEDLKNLKATTISSPSDTTSIRIDYLSREMVNGMLLPKQVQIAIQSARQEISIHMDYKKTRLNENEQIHFVIPENYLECE